MIVKLKACILEVIFVIAAAVADFNFGIGLGELVNDLPDDLMQGYDGQQGGSSDLQTPIHAQPGHDNASLQALLARSTPNSQHSMANSTNTMANASHASATVGAMASAGLNVNTVKSPLSNSLSSPSHTATMNKAATATSSHMVGAGDGLPNMNFSMATTVGANPMMNSMGMKPMGPNAGQMMGGVPGMPGVGMQQPHHNQMMNGPSFPPNMGQMRSMAPTTMGNAPPLTIGQNNMIVNSQMPQMSGHQSMGHVMNVPQNQVQMAKVSISPSTVFTNAVVCDLINAMSLSLKCSDSVFIIINALAGVILWVLFYD